jgi:hypothetical protein
MGSCGAAGILSIGGSLSQAASYDRNCLGCDAGGVVDDSAVEEFIISTLVSAGAGAVVRAIEAEAAASVGRTLARDSVSATSIGTHIPIPSASGLLDAIGTVGAGEVTEGEGASTEAARLFRADSRGPEEIFSRGFEPKGASMDLWTHVTQNPADSGFVSTSKGLASAQDFAQESSLDYIYKLRATGIDVNETFGEASPFPWENEVAVPGSISGSAIEGAWGPEGWLDNSAFAP